MPDACTHDKVTRIALHQDAPEWTCSECGDAFIPYLDAYGTLNDTLQRHDDILDTVTGMFSAVLWDLHQRVAEGQPVAGDDVDQETFAESVCEELGHDIDPTLGKCKRCQFNPFIGG